MIIVKVSPPNWNEAAGATAVDGKYYDIAGAPLYFVRSGYISVYTLSEGAVGGTGLFQAGRNPLYFASTYDANAVKVYDLSFTDTTVYPYHSTDPQLGGSVRCIAR